MTAAKPAPRRGEAKNSWLTGTAAWNFVAVSQHLLGIRPEHEGLRVKPGVPRDLGRVTVVRRRRGATYRTVVEDSGSGRASLVVDGKPIDGTIVPYAAPGTTV